MSDGVRERTGGRTRPARAASPAVAAMGDEVSPVELLFDLVFVFAVSQLSHHLLEHLTWRGALETLVMLTAVFGIWSLTSFGASMPGIGRRAETGTLLVVLVLGLLFNAGISRAFQDQPWLFAGPFLLCNIGIVVFYLLGGTSPLMRRHAVSMGVWVAPSTVLWVAGTLAQPDGRVWWWLAGALVDLTGAWSAHRLPGRRFRTAEVPFAPAHMLERSRLFLIITLGETILTTGTALAAAEIHPATLVAAVLALLGTVALWALYFGGSHRLVTEHATLTGDPLQAARLAINGQIVTAAGLITLAVGYELTITEPTSRTAGTLALLLFGGPLLYLALQTWYLRALTGRFSRLRLLGAAGLAVTGALTATLPSVLALAASTALLGLIAARVTLAARSLPLTGDHPAPGQ